MHRRFLKEQYGLKNLALHRLPVEEVGSLGHEYDLLVSTGVLHHMADPAAGMRALAARLRPDGVAAIMLYARYGPIGVEMLQGVFRDLSLAQDEPSLAAVKAAIAALPQDHPLRSYLSVAPDLEFDAGLVDGRCTIHEILAAAAQSTTASARSPANLERFARTLFESLVNRDFLVLSLRR